MKKYTIIILLFLCGCAKEPTQDTIKFTYNSAGIIMLPVTIADTTINMLFDTGATVTVINNINNRWDNIIDTVNKTYNICYIALLDTIVYVPTTKPKQLLIGKLKTSNIKMPILNNENSLDLEYFKYIEDLDIEDIFGHVLGCDVINQFHWHFNFKTQEVTIQKQPFAIPENIKQNHIDYYLYKNTFYAKNITIKDGDNIIKNIKRDFFKNGIFIDFGCKDLYGKNDFPVIITCKKSIEDQNTINKITTDFNSGNKPNIKSITESIVSNKSNTSNTLMLQYNNLNINNIQMKNVSVVFADKAFKMANTIGINFFRQFAEIYIDTKERVIYLKPYEEDK